MSVEDAHVYPSSQAFTHDQNFQRATYPDSNCSTQSLEAPESDSARIRNLPAQEKLCKRVFNKLKGWLNRLLSYLY